MQTEAAAIYRETRRMLNDEEGMAILAVMLILVLLTIIGIASTNVSNTEVTIAGNQAVYQQTLYLAEGAAIAAVEALEKESDPLSLTWVDGANTMTADQLNSNIIASGEDSLISFPNHTSRYYVDYIGVSSGSSLGIASSKVHEFSVYGRDEVTASGKEATTVVNIGYLMAF